MITIEIATWIGIGFITGFCLSIIIRFLFKRKPKHDLQSIKKIVYETGMQQKAAYEGVKYLEQLFKEMETK